MLKPEHIGGWGLSPTGESFRFVRSCVRERGLVAQWSSISKDLAALFSSSFCLAELSFLGPPKPPIHL